MNVLSGHFNTAVWGVYNHTSERLLESEIVRFYYDNQKFFFRGNFAEAKVVMSLLSHHHNKVSDRLLRTLTNLPFPELSKWRWVMTRFVGPDFPDHVCRLVLRQWGVDRINQECWIWPKRMRKFLSKLGYSTNLLDPKQIDPTKPVDYILKRFGFYGLIKLKSLNPSGWVTNIGRKLNLDFLTQFDKNIYRHRGFDSISLFVMDCILRDNGRCNRIVSLHWDIITRNQHLVGLDRNKPVLVLSTRSFMLEISSRIYFVTDRVIKNRLNIPIPAFFMPSASLR